MIIGTAGHIDHGKTALVKAITGVDADRLKEEKARGITIELGFAYWPIVAGELDGEVVGFVDVPGHERLVHTMLAGATGLDAVMLCVALDDGIMPQTREHLDIIRLLGITQGIAVLTKADLADAARVAAVRAKIAALLAGTPLADAEIVAVSSRTGAGIEALKARLLALRGPLDTRPDEKRFRLAVDRCFTLAGAGTVVTGTVLSGEVRVGMPVIVSPAGLEARVRSLHAQGRPTQEGTVGQRCALNLAGPHISKDAIGRGDVVLEAALHAPADRVDAYLTLLPTAKPLRQWLPVRLHAGAADVAARVVLLGTGDIGPGGAGLVQLVLERPLALCVGDRFILRDTSAQYTVGGGTLLDVRAPARKRRLPERLRQLDALLLPQTSTVLVRLLEEPPFSVVLQDFARDRALWPASVEGIAAQESLITVPSGQGTLLFAAGVWLRWRRGIAEALKDFHRENADLSGMPAEKLRLSVAPLVPALRFRAVLARLQVLGDVALEGGFVRLPGHVAQLSAEDERLRARILPLLAGETRFSPPRVRDIAALLRSRDDTIRAVLRRMARRGEVDEVAADHYFLRGAVAELVLAAREVSEAQPDGFFVAAQYRDRLDMGRRLAILILEFFDKHGVTIRRGDRRRMNPHRLDLFAVQAASSEDDKSGSQPSTSKVTPWASGRVVP